MQNVFNKRKEEINEFNTLLEELNLRKKNEEVSPKEVPDDLMCKCPSCGKIFLRLIMKVLYLFAHHVAIMRAYMLKIV